MAFEYEALVGHLYIVNRRFITAPPPGLLVEVAPKKAARGRETDTFFTLVLPSGDSIATSAFYEQMAKLSAEQYFNNSGSVTNALRAVFSHLNENLFEHNLNSAKHYEASIICVVLRGADLYVGKVGSTVALFRHDTEDPESESEAFPADFDNDEALFSPPLGVQPVPDARMARYEVKNHSRLVLAEATFADLNLDQTTQALLGDDIGTVLETLKTLVGDEMSLMAVEFVPPQEPVALPIREGESTAVINAPKLATNNGGGANGSAAASAAPDAQTAVAVAEKTKAPPKPEVPSPLEAPMRQSIGKTATGLATGFETANKVVDRLLPPTPDEQQNRSPWLTGAAVVIPIVVVLLVVSLWLTGTGESEYDLCVDEAMTAGEVARQIPSNDVNGTVNAWNAVLTVIDRCDELRPPDIEDGLAEIRTEGRGILDRLIGIDRREMIPLAAFPEAGLERLVLQGEDVFVLDDRNDLVYKVTLTSDGRGVVAGTQQPIPSMRRTAQVNEFTVGDLIDITWAQEGAGLSQANVLLAVDSNGVIIECPPRFLLSCESQRLLGSENWVSPVAVTLWQGRLYVLDPAANQLWRYEPTGGAFANAPTEYFVGDARPDIRNAVDFDIDDNGTVFLLFSDGVMTRFISGELQPFAFSGFPAGQSIAQADSMFLNTNPVAQDIYFVGSDDRTIYQTTMAGTYIASYRPQDELQFNQLSAVTVDTNQRMVYAASGNAIFAFDRVDTAPEPVSE